MSKINYDSKFTYMMTLGVKTKMFKYFGNLEIVMTGLLRKTLWHLMYDSNTDTNNESLSMFSVVSRGHCDL